MPTYSRRTRVAAPLSRVWAFHSRIDGLETLTPGFMNLRVEAIRSPGEETAPEELDVGTEVRLSVRPFGVGPRQRWTSRVTDRVESDGSAWFRDEMVDGPFRRWVHTHQFFGDGDRTVVVDRVEYELPCGPVGEALGPVAVVGFEPLFRERHRRTGRELEATTIEVSDGS